MGIYKRGKTSIKTAAALLTITGAMFVGGQTANASAYTCTSYGSYVPGIGYPSNFCGDTVSSGNFVTSVRGAFSTSVASAGTLSNTRVRVEFLNTANSVYSSYLSSIQAPASTSGSWTFVINGTKQNGTIRYTLLSNGNVVAVRSQSFP
jgi:hypothetical protein